MFVTDLAGRVLARNPAARDGDPLAAASGGAEAARYRLTREAGLNGIAGELASDGRSRIVVTRHGRRTLLWRIEPVEAPRPAASLREAGIPWLRLDGDGRVLDSNPAAAALAGGPPGLDMLADPPLRPDGVHLLAATGRAVRAVVLPGADGLPRPPARPARRRRGLRASCPTTSSTSCRWRSPASRPTAG